jgi:hypothetical protein
VEEEVSSKYFLEEAVCFDLSLEVKEFTQEVVVNY